MNSEKLLEAKNIINETFNINKKYACLFSGGKDSVITYHLLKELNLADKVQFIYIGSGMETSSLNKFLNSYPELIRIQPNIPIDEIWKKTKRLPEVRPVFTYELLNQKSNYIEENKYHLYCCYRIRHILRLQYLITHQFDYVFTGNKKLDKINGKIMLASIFRLDNINYINPIYNWSNDDCWDYINENNIACCEDYEKLGGTYTCALCSCLSPNSNNNHISNLSKYYPELLERYKSAAKYCYENNPELQSIYSDWEDYFNTWINKDEFRRRVYNIELTTDTGFDELN